MRRLWLVVGLLLTVALAGCSGARDTIVGDPAIVSDWSMPDALTAVEFEVPTGTVTISVGQPIVDDVRLSSDREDLIAAPDGGVLLPIELDFRASSGRTGTTEPPLPVVAALILDGRSHPLPDAYRVVDGEIEYGSGTAGWYLPVAANASERILTLEYDGLTQSFNLDTGERNSGAAEIWYGQDWRVAGECPTSGWTGDLAGIVDGNCFSMAAYLVPYFADLGWAEPGHRWLVLFAAVDPVLEGPELDEMGFTADGLDPFAVSLDSVFITVNDVGPVGSAGTSGPFVYSSAPDSDGYQIFDVASGSATIVITSDVTFDYGLPGTTDETSSKSGDIKLTFDVNIL